MFWENIVSKNGSKIKGVYDYLQNYSYRTVTDPKLDPINIWTQEITDCVL